MNFFSVYFIFTILTAYVYSAANSDRKRRGKDPPSYVHIEANLDSNTPSVNNEQQTYENVYLINLNSRPDRLNYMTEILNEIGQPFTRIEAVNGKELLESCKDRPMSSIYPKIVYTCKDFLRDNSEDKCKPGEVGCWLSHLKIYFQIVENFEKTGRDNPTLILEDDIDMELDFKFLVKDLVTKLPSNWELFYPGYHDPKFIRRVNRDIASIGQYWGTFSYVVRNVNVAKKLIQLANKSVCQIADVFNLEAVKRDQLKSYHSHPRQLVTYDENLGYDIDHPTLKICPHFCFKLRDSALQKIKRRKGEL